MSQRHPSDQTAGDRVLKWIGLEPADWSPGDRRLALLAIGILVAIVTTAVCGYVFRWEWTGLVKPEQRTFWDWLNLLIVPVVLALGGYFFNRSENRRAREDARQQRHLDNQIAEARRQDDTLREYLDAMAELITSKDYPLHRAQLGNRLSALARARTLTVLRRLKYDRKASVLQFLHESGLIRKEHPIVDLWQADMSLTPLSYANLRGAFLRGVVLGKSNLVRTDLRGADLSYADLREATLHMADLRGADLRGVLIRSDPYAWMGPAHDKDSDVLEQRVVEIPLREGEAHPLEGATMPNGQKYEDWLKNEVRGKAMDVHEKLEKDRADFLKKVQEDIDSWPQQQRYLESLLEGVEDRGEDGENSGPS